VRERGFSLVEMMVVVAIFTIITGAVFGLMTVAQQRYKMEAEFLDSFQGARLALDQIVRDVHVSGYPPIDKVMSAVAAANPELFAHQMAWSGDYPNTPCVVGGCAIPAAFDIILETDVDPEAVNGVEWVRYRLRGGTLFRGMATKTKGGDPATATLPNLVAYLENVVNDPNGIPAAQRAVLQLHYPGLWPGGVAVPMFQYRFGASPTGTAVDVEEVHITLMVMAPNLDPQTRQPRVLVLTGLAHRFNP